MDLERVAAVIRPRSPWEAIDLGFGMVRAWWRPLGSAWLATVAPVWCLVFLLFSGKPGLALLILWWLRPLFDRVPLHVVSRCLFGAPPSVGAVVTELPKLWGRDLLAALIVQRLDPARSFHLAIGQLEGLSGPARRRRRSLLDHSGRAAAIWLTAACSLLELIAVVSLFGLINLLSPQGSRLGPAIQAAATDGNLPYWLGLVIGGLSCLAYLLIEPFYVAAGFSLYLSRRTLLEGWDVEISFRRLAGRLLKSTRGRAAAVLLALALSGLGATSSFAATPTDPSEAIQRILATPELRTHQKVSRWLPKKGLPSRQSQPDAPDLPDLTAAAEVIRIVVFVIAGALIAFLVILIVRAASGWRRRQPTPPEEAGALPEAVFGLDIRPESLPADVAAAAWAAWEQGDAAGALGLLYRGALACLVHRDGLEVAASWTEGDCLAVVRRRAAPAATEYFARLTRAWQSTAYAHRPPDREEAKALCDGWRQHYHEAREEAA